MVSCGLTRFCCARRGEPLKTIVATTTSRADRTIFMASPSGFGGQGNVIPRNGGCLSSSRLATELPDQPFNREPVKSKRAGAGFIQRARPANRTVARHHARALHLHIE